MARRKASMKKAKPQDLGKTIPEQLHPFIVEIGTLTLDPQNARMHDERNIESIAASLKRFGQRRLAVVQKTGLVVKAGNGMVTAAKRLGWTKIAALVVDDDDVEAAAFAIADNRTAELAEWNFEQIAELISKYKLDASEHALGFSVEEIESIVSTRPWDTEATDTSGAGDDEEGDDEEGEDRNVAVTIKVKVIDIPYRARVQKAIQELIETEFKGLAKVQ